ncbi:MAG: S8 family peptidase [Planctomycetota bacterium]
MITRFQSFAIALVLVFAGVASAGDLYVVVGFKGLPDAALLKKLGATPGDAIGGQDALRATLPASVVSRLRKHADIAFVEENGIMKAFKGKPENPGNGGGGGGGDSQETPWGIDRVNAASSDNKGSGVKVAIVDTGIDLDHPDLKDNIQGSKDFTGARRGADDEHGHGSHVAGTVAAVNNTVGVIGVAPDADLYAVRVLDRRGSGRWADLADALDWCAHEDNGMDIANMSLGGSSAPGFVETACINALADGVLLIAAAGNSGDGDDTTPEKGFPAGFLSVVSVGATNSDDDVAFFSNTGHHVEVSAPGVSILSTYKKRDYATLSGTSMASPHAAGIAALLWSDIDSPTAASVRTELKLRVFKKGGFTGHDNGYGYGIVDYDETGE